MASGCRRMTTADCRRTTSTPWETPQ
jgi:hypothetical protein